MTTWTTFETIDESAQRSEFAVRSFYVDRLGVHQYRQDERTRFKLERVESGQWRVIDLEEDEHTNPLPMRDAVRWVAGRVLYGA